jgi:glycosyltransferase involved in cell wall biosynthesis
MKIYFTNSMLEACWFVREYIPMVAGGWDGDRTSLIKNYRSANSMATHAYQAMEQTDVVVFHRANDDRAFNVAIELKKLGKKIVYDNDDTYKNFVGLERHLLKRLEYVDKWTDQFIKIADLVTCSTEFLAEEYRKLNKNVLVLPNCVEPSDWPDEPQRNTNGKVRIGIVGSAGANQDFEPIQDILPKLCQRDDVEIVLFGLPPKTNDKVIRMYKKEFDFWDKLKIEWQPFVGIQDYIETLDNLKLDLMLIPRNDDYFNRCKSNLKFLEASMLEIPVICQGFPDRKSPYEINPLDRKFTNVITDNSQWEDMINAWITPQAKELRRSHGKAAKQYVLENYDINKHIEKWEEAYQNLLS